MLGRNQHGKSVLITVEFFFLIIQQASIMLKPDSTSCCEVLAERHAMFASMFLSTLLWVVVYCSICFSGPVIQQFACVNQQIRIC
jgi:hypothetical protein